MSTRKFWAFLLVPLAVMLAVGASLAAAEGEVSPRADALGSLMGRVFGVYAGILTIYWWRKRKATTDSHR